MRIFLGLDNTCGYYSQLEKGLKSIGVACEFVNAYPNRDYKKFFKISPVGKLIEWLGLKRVKAERGTLTRYFWTILEAATLPFLLLVTLFRYDVYVFSGGTTFFAPFDLWILKLFRKKVIVVYHGSDSRAPYMSPITTGVTGDFDIQKCIDETKLIKKRLQTIERYADIIINNPAASHLHERKLINWHCIGIPYDCPKFEVQIVESEGPCVIVHAPTRPEFKGSVLIEEAINSLVAEGHNIKFVKLIGRKHSEVLEEISKCDFVVDELYSDVIMASFATEAASFGKPAIVGMFEFSKILSTIHQKDMIPPIVNCTADNVKDAIKELVTNKKLRLEIGAAARQFVEQQWNPTVVAQRFVKLATNEISNDWYFNPNDIARLHGWGLTDSRAREVMRKVVEFGGVSALHLKNNPDLEKRCLEFIRTNA